jgi:hypothetical protein
MKRQALAAALLALLTSAPLDAGLGGSKAIFTCGTDPEPARRTEGRVDTAGLSALSFKPDFRGTKPLLIPYKSITRLEFGPTPGRRAETFITPPCVLKRQDRYLTIFYDLEKQKEREKVHIAVFDLGEGVLRQTLRIVEARSGKRVTYQDAAARKAAR